MKKEIKKQQVAVGAFMVAVFAITAIVASSSDLSLTRTASAGYGSDTGQRNRSEAARRREERARNKKHHKSSQKTSEQKVEEFSGFNNPQAIEAYRTVSALKKTNPSRFRALEIIFNKYNKVGGRLRVQPSAQTVAAINQFRNYNGYSIYLNHLARLKK